MGLKGFLSDGHDDNTDLVLRIKRDLTAAGHRPWIDIAEIKTGGDWRRSILDGLADTHRTLAFLSHHAMRMRHGNLATILVEPDDEVQAPVSASHIPAHTVNAEWQRDLAFSYERIGIVSRAQGDLPGALDAYRAGREIDERLALHAPDNAQVQRDLFISLREVARLATASGDCAAACP